MFYVTCENHKNLRWLVKPMAISATGRYNGSRNLHFCGRILTQEEKEAKNRETGDTSSPYPFDTAEVIGGTVVRECKCFTDRLTIAPESLEAFQAEFNLSDEYLNPIRERLTQTQPVTVRIRDLVIPASVRMNPFEGIESLFRDVKTAEAIREPVKVRSTGSGELVLVDGFRRIYCAIALGLREVPAIIG